MNSKIFLTLGLTTILATGCGGGGNGSSNVIPTLPAGAIIIDSSNASTIASSAVGTFDGIYSAVNGVEATSLPPMGTALNTIKSAAFNKDKLTSNIVTGVTTTTPCDSGNISDSYSSTATSDTGTLTFNNCSLAGISFSGSFSYSSTWDNSTAAYTDTGNGSITLTVQSTSFVVAMNLSETGNFTTGNYSINVSFSLSGGGVGFLATTQTSLTGTNFGLVSAGSVIVQGANNSRLRIDITSTTSADVYLDQGTGTFTYHSTISI